MANGNDPPLSNLSISVVEDREDLGGERDPNEFLTFSNPVPDSPSEFRTGTTDRLKGLVQELATARQSAAREREEAKREAARRASAGLISTLGSKGLTQALTGVDVGSEERSAQAEQRLREAESARREAETEAETVEETSDIQADVKAAQLEREEEQRTQELAQRGKEINTEQIQSSISAINSALENSRSAQRQKDLLNRRFSLKKNLEKMRFRQELALAGIDSSQEDSDKIVKAQEAILNYVGALDNAKSQIRRAYDQYDRDQGRLESGASQMEELQGIASSLPQTLNRLEKARQRLTEEAGISLPEGYTKMEDQIVSIGNAITGVPSGDQALSEFSPVLRSFQEDYYNNINQFEPTATPFVERFSESLEGGEDDSGGGRGGNVFDNF